MARIRTKSSWETAKEAAQLLWSAALYIRLSRDDGNDESLSVSNQRKILLEYMEDSFPDPYILYDIYIDDGQSGTDHQRPGFQRMICDIESGKVNCVICKNLSRAFRNYSDQGYFLESFFPRFHTRFITLGDPKIDTFINPEAVNGMEVPINGLMNDRFASKTSSDIRRTFDTKRRNGEFIGAFAPYGYAKDPQNKNHLVIDQEAALVVKNIFRWYVYGDEKGALSKEGIARKLNMMGIPNPASYKKSKGMKYCNPQTGKNDGLWQGASITAILSNETYTGTLVQGKQRVISYKVHDRTAVPKAEWYRVPGTHEPVIDTALFQLAGEIQKKDRRRPPGKQQNHLFSGFLRCADCKKAMTRKQSKNIVYYNCSTYKRKSKTACTLHSIRLDILEPAVLAAIQKEILKISDPEKITAKISAAPTVKNSPLKPQDSLCTAHGELKKIEQAAADLYLDWKNGILTYEQYKNLQNTFEIKSQKLKDRIESIEHFISVSCESSPPPDSCFHDFLKYKNVRFLTPGLLSELVKNIYVHEGGAVTIEFKFHDPLKPFTHFPMC